MKRAYSLEFSDKFMVATLADLDDLVETLKLWLRESDSVSCTLTKMPEFKPSHYEQPLR